VRSDTDQRVHVAIGDCVDGAAATAIATAGSAARDVLLAPERGDAVPALAGVDFDDGFVDELHKLKSPIATIGLFG
jgi:hypothetical protein